MAKASFSAYVLVKNLLKTGEKVHFSTQKSTTNFGRPFCFFPFPFFASKWLKCAVFALQKGKNVGRKRGLRHFFFLFREGKGESEATGGGGVSFRLTIPGGGAVFQERGGGGAAGRVSAGI